MTKLQNQLLCKLALSLKKTNDIQAIVKLFYNRVLPCFGETEDINQEPAVFLFVHRMMELTGQPPTLGDAQKWRCLACEAICQKVVDGVEAEEMAAVINHDTQYLRAQGVIRDRVRMD